MKKAFDEAVKKNMGTLVLMVPILILAWYGIYTDNTHVAKERDEARRNASRHAASQTDRDELRHELDEIARRLEALEKGQRR